ncbi:hypothetical protein F511_37679 [Dorcoceras hygrometricum]|uniref:AT-hook motif nuclear-localized protein n=1 Tax=Dorcoceras hygrometricum TaxID=472368 RepID=A0A2Z7ADA7_9LAMI|nr:hypothetical protein F511_37679 [Dorcoceras hygrometricum]
MPMVRVDYKFIILQENLHFHQRNHRKLTAVLEGLAAKTCCVSCFSCVKASKSDSCFAMKAYLYDPCVRSSAGETNRRTYQPWKSLIFKVLGDKTTEKAVLWSQCPFVDQELSLEEQTNTSVPETPVEQEAPLSPEDEENAIDMEVNMTERTNDGEDDSIDGEFNERRKRGRPKKEAEVLGQQELVLTPESFTATQPKRGRGRPKGTGKWQTLAASFGGVGVAVSAAAGSNFTPYVMIIPTGENIAQRIWSVSQSQRASDSICVLSASGTVSIAEILQPGPLGANVKYEGRFDIVSLTGSHIYTERGPGGRRVARLSVQLATPDGRIFGGIVGSSLIAAVPTQLVVATFKHNTKELPKARRVSRTEAVTSSMPPPAEIGNVVNTPEENQASPTAVHENSCPEWFERFSFISTEMKIR